MRKPLVVIVIFLAGLALGIMAEQIRIYGKSKGLTDETRRGHLLMPQKDSPTYKEWVAKYGDSANSWELFTLSFHTRYMQELTKKVNALSKDANEPNQPAKTN